MNARSLAVLLLLLGGCGSETDERPVSWQYIASAILRPSCATSNCHSERAAVSGLDLHDPESAYRSLVKDGGAVDTSDLAGSQLLFRIRGTSVEDRMPPDQPLPNADIELIERWIEEGAQNN